MGLSWKKYKESALYGALLRAAKKPERIFLVVAAFFGVLAVFIIPPGWNSDEYQHLFRVEQLSSGQLFSRDEIGQKSEFVGGHIDTGVVTFINSVGRFADNTETRENLSFKSLWLTSPHYDEGGTTYVGFNGSAVYPPVTYIPQILGTLSAKTVNASVYVSILLARIFGLVVFLVALFWAIRITPRGKWILFTVALLPTSVVQAAALGADAMTFSIIALFIAYTFKLAYGREDLTKKRIAILLLLMVVMGLIKPTYFILTPLILLIPLVNKKYYNFKTLLLLAGMMALAVLPAGLWLLAVGYVGGNGGDQVDKSMQLSHMLGDPIGFISTFMGTYFGVTSSGSWNHFYDIGFRNFVWDTVKFSNVYSYLAVVALVVSLGIKDGVRIGSNQRKKVMENILMVGIFVAAFMLMNVALYLYFTPVGQGIILGVQARYLFPFLILLLLPLQNYLTNQRKAKVSLVGILIVCLLASVVAIFKAIHEL